MDSNIEPLVDGAAASSDELSPVIRSLRFRGDEVQFGRVLAAVCQEPDVARAFVEAVIEGAAGGHPAAERRLLPVPDDVVCVDERILRARVGRLASRQRAKDAGRVDLDFGAGDRWRMFVELKLGSDFAATQLERYTREGPVAAVVRDPTGVPDLAANPNWVGAVGWSSLLDALRTLPLSGRTKPQWHGLLDVMVAEGDFAAATPLSLPEIADAQALLGAIADDVVSEFGAALVRRHGPAAANLAERLRAGRVSGGNGPWAGFAVGTREEGDWLWIALRNLWSRAPRLRTWYYEYPDSHAKHKNRKALKSIERDHAFERRDAVSWVREDTVPTLARRDADRLRREVLERVTILVDAGLFGVAVSRNR